MEPFDAIVAARVQERARLVDAVARLERQVRAEWEALRPDAQESARAALTRCERGYFPDLVRGLGLAEREKPLTRLLAWLLRPREGHGLDGALLGAVLEELDLDVAATDLAAWTVRREPFLDHEDGRKASPDLVLQGPCASDEALVMIEHKLGAQQSSPDQYPRYRALLESSAGDRPKKLVFLRTAPRRADDPDPGDPGDFDAVWFLDDLLRLLVRAERAVVPEDGRRLLRAVRSSLSGVAPPSGLDVARLRSALADEAAAVPLLIALTRRLKAWDDQSEPDEAPAGKGGEMRAFDEVSSRYAAAYHDVEVARLRFEEQRAALFERVFEDLHDLVEVPAGVAWKTSADAELPDHEEPWARGDNFDEVVVGWRAMVSDYETDESDWWFGHVLVWIPALTEPGAPTGAIYVVTRVLDDRFAEDWGIDTPPLPALDSARIADLRALPDAPGDPANEGPDDGVQYASGRLVLRISRLPLAEATVQDVTRTVAAHVGYAGQVVRQLESSSPLGWAAGRLAEAVAAVEPPPGWHRQHGGAEGEARPCAGFYLPDEDDDEPWVEQVYADYTEQDGFELWVQKRSTRGAAEKARLDDLASTLGLEAAKSAWLWKTLVSPDGASEARKADARDQVTTILADAFRVALAAVARSRAG